METVMEEVEYIPPDDSAWNCELDISQLCRICANPNEYLIPIFQDEGLEHDLINKINKHLPIKVTERDKLPTNLCYQCASTLIAWHDMVIGCLEADERLKALIHDENYVDDKQIVDDCSAQFINEVEINSGEIKSYVPQRAEATEAMDVQDVVHVIKQDPTSESIKVVEENTALEPEFTEEVSSDPRLEPFNAYHQTQVALRMQQWVSNGSVFCMLCGILKQNQITLIKHLSIDHKIRCGHCRACFASEDQLSAHKTIHENKKYDKDENMVNNKKNHSLQQSKNEISFNCCVCDKKFKRKMHFQLHFKQQHPEIQICNQLLSKNCQRKCLSIQCDICSTLFSKRYDLKRHKLKHHSGENLDLIGKENGSNNVKDKNVSIPDTGAGNKVGDKNKSDIEDEINFMNYSDDSVTSEDISRHLDIKPPPPGQVMAEIRSCDQNYSCSSCDYTCSNKQEMVTHQKKEHNIQEQKKGSFESKLQGHIPSKPFSCSLCKNSYSRSSDLQRHFFKKHGGEKFVGRCVDSVDDMDVEIINRAKQDINGIIVYRCDVCEKNMLTKRGFVRHVRIHTGERPFTCHICGKQYRSNTDLTRHLRCVHDGIKNYQCDVCGRFFANKGTRNDHRRTHTGEKPFVCHVCGKSFPTPNSIYVHRRIHTDYFPHHCTSCDKKFRRRQQLMNHMRTHTGEKPHACDICGKCFGVKDEVSRHRLTHSNEKPHVCPVCGVCFGQKRYLSNHMKTHHSRML